MDCKKAGNLIRSLRLEKGLTQLQLADKMNISDKTVSKWERGFGAPDVSLLSELSSILETNIEELLNGKLPQNEFVGGNMKNSKFYVCENCSNITICSGNASVSCCGRKLSPLELTEASENEKLLVENSDGDWFITSHHPMEKYNYISFIAFATDDKLQIYKQYPEWTIQQRIPKRQHGLLIWYSTDKKLLYQKI